MNESISNEPSQNASASINASCETEVTNSATSPPGDKIAAVVYAQIYFRDRLLADTDNSPPNKTT